MPTPFRIADAQFIEAAYVSGQSKMSVSSRDLAGSRALGASVVQAILGLPGGMFVLHQNRWNFIPWANVKSTQLVDVPPEITEAAGVQAQSDAPGAYLRPALASGGLTGRQTPSPATQQAIPTLPAEVGQVPARRGPGRPPRKVQPEIVAPSDLDDLVGGVEPMSVALPPALPARDEMGVLLSIQPTDGPKMQCPACFETFIRGTTHACKKLPV